MDALAKYQPEVSVLEQFKVDPQSPDYAFEVYQQLLQAKRGHQLMFLAVGKLLKEIRDNKLYLKLDYEHFEDFLASEEVSYSRESAYMFIRIYEFYFEGLGFSEERIASITLSKLSMMIPLVKDLEKDAAIEKIEELSSLRHNDFLIRAKQQKGDDKPKVWYSNEVEKYCVQYFSDRTQLIDQGSYEEFLKK